MATRPFGDMTWLIPLLAFAANAIGLGPLSRFLAARAVLDQPNARSSHDRPVPRGAGLLLVPVVAAGWIAIDPDQGFVCLIGVALGALFWLDDLHQLPVLPRLVAQAASVAAGILLLPTDATVFQGLLPIWADRLVAGLAWLWFVNLFNFMDGIDGLSGVAALAVGGGALGMGLLAGGPDWIAPAGAVLAAAAAGFLIWNRPPARIFLGDVGSIGLGYLIGWLLLQLAAAGHWAAALLLPLYHLADASLTLLRRLARGEAIWRPARAHFYQRAADAFGTHAAVTLRVAGLQVALVAVALAAARTGLNWAGVIAGSAATAGLLWYFATVPRK